MTLKISLISTYYMIQMVFISLWIWCG